MYDDLKNEAVKNNIPIIQDNALIFLLDFIKKNNIKSVLEVGSAVGYSSINMAGICDVSVFTIERDKERYNQALSNIKKYNLENKIEIVNEDALEIDVLNKFDLIFIDASKSQNIKFFEKFKNNLNNDGYIITDNINFHGMHDVDQESLTKNVRGIIRKLKLYIEFLENNEEFTTTFLDIGDKISISKRK